MEHMIEIKERIALMNHEARIKDIERNYFARHELKKYAISFFCGTLLSIGNMLVDWGVALQKSALENTAGDVRRSKTVPLASRR